MTIEQAIKRARDDSRNGYVQHVNKHRDEYYVSDWCDGSTVASFEKGHRIDTQDEHARRAVPSDDCSYDRNN